MAGKVQEAEGGTLFLDEVGELTADAQVRLLRFLNDRTYERLGDARERQADVRLIAATNRDLDAEVRSGRFREDLFYRLNVITLRIPALRERSEDILAPGEPLPLHLQPEARPRRADRSRTSPKEAMLAHTWPGNLRELRNAVERAVILAPEPSSLPPISGLHQAAGVDRDGQPEQTARVGAPVSLAALQREHIARVVAQASSLEAAARVLGIDATTLQRKRKRFGLA